MVLKSERIARNKNERDRAPLARRNGHTPLHGQRCVMSDRIGCTDVRVRVIPSQPSDPRHGVSDRTNSCD